MMVMVHISSGIILPSQNESGYNSSMKLPSLVILTLCFACSSQTPREKTHESTKVLLSLRAAGLSGTKTAQTESFRAENVSCLKDLTKNIWKCGFISNGKNFEIPEKESEVLSGILFDLPVAQGDSGAATPFIECRMYDGDPENAQCDVAISLDYQGP